MIYRIFGIRPHTAVHPHFCNIRHPCPARIADWKIRPQPAPGFQTIISGITTFFVIKHAEQKILFQNRQFPLFVSRLVIKPQSRPLQSRQAIKRAPDVRPGIQPHQIRRSRQIALVFRHRSRRIDILAELVSGAPSAGNTAPLPRSRRPTTNFLPRQKVIHRLINTRLNHSKLLQTLTYPIHTKESIAFWVPFIRSNLSPLLSKPHLSRLNQKNNLLFLFSFWFFFFLIFRRF